MKYRFINFIFLLFPILAILNLISLVIDVYTYQGFFEKHFLISDLILFNFLFITGMVISLFLSKHIPPTIHLLDKIVFCLSFFLLPFFIIVYIYFIELSLKEYPNYIFYNYHIQYQNIPILIFLSAFILFNYFYRKI